MKLHVETHGSGPDMVLVHGWGVNSGVWQRLLPVLKQRYRITCVDLPGHGASREVRMSSSLAAVATQVLEVAPPSALWLGWSLGGLICLQIAMHAPLRVRALMLSNTTPRFITAADWPHAMPPAQLDAFAMELNEDFAETVRRFLALQVLGDERARDTLRALRDSVLARGEPDQDSLVAGLGILRDSDVRSGLHRISAPTLVLTGDYDRLTPPQAGQALAEMIADAKLRSFPRTSHAPFISHPVRFADALDDFMNTLTPQRAHDRAN
ncbi:MAG: pimeloyl-ACP methyl ester esterase BioH [Gammaproteobacteria bacterium]